MKKLQRLWLPFNKLESLPANISLLTTLKELNVSENTTLGPFAMLFNQYTLPQLFDSLAEHHQQQKTKGKEKVNSSIKGDPTTSSFLTMLCI